MISIYKKIYSDNVYKFALDLSRKVDIGLHRGVDLAGKRVHVLMPGSSVIESVGQIDSNDFVIGFNLASFLPVKLDLIFVENSNNTLYSSLQYKSCSFQAGLGSKTLIKNLWMKERHDKDVLMAYNEFSEFVIDVPLRPSFIANKFFLKKWLLNADYAYSSFMSSSFFALNYLFLSGAKEIILHGIDFGGQYFWEVSDFLCVEDHRLKNIKSNKIHPTEIGRLAFSKIITYLVDSLRENEVEVYAANSEGSLGKLLCPK